MDTAGTPVKTEVSAGGTGADALAAFTLASMGVAVAAYTSIVPTFTFVKLKGDIYGRCRSPGCTTRLALDTLPKCKEACAADDNCM